MDEEGREDEEAEEEGRVEEGRGAGRNVGCAETDA